MTVRFLLREPHPIHDTVKVTSAEPRDEASGFARDWAMRWCDSPDFPDHPFRDKGGHIILPDSLEMSPEAYVDAHEPPPAPHEPAARYPFSGPANIVRGPATSSETIAFYERSRRGLKRLNVKPPPEPYVAPTPAAKGHTPSFTPNDPKIPPRVYSRDKFDPKYRKPGAIENG
jgi:hypothetical protein